MINTKNEFSVFKKKLNEKKFLSILYNFRIFMCKKNIKISIQKYKNFYSKSRDEKIFLGTLFNFRIFMCKKNIRISILNFRIFLLN
ncbi:hypothetical protein BpHYR1_012269 [Brachionus plicatilis]|uniref:Uncharacterized protein n=1 Tax=Brachionus plicatilis TaxID=10195 RepID=A0A3M7S9J1_BRAPC|nr:hypothetical protein BpHYR1_012269 [Brachionus plicatilis]